MIDIARHIEALLLDNDCVIVPEFGGFITQYVPARYIIEEQLFLPPHRTIGFNPKMSINDGLLVQSFMQTYGSTYPEAVLQVKGSVQDIKDTLATKGEMILKGIGRLYLDINDTINFSPSEAGVVSPVLYGLDSFLTPTAKATATAKPTPIQTKKPAAPTQEEAHKHLDSSTSKRTYTLSLNREVCNYVASVVVALVFYFLWATPVGVSNATMPAATVVATAPALSAIPTPRAGQSVGDIAARKIENATPSANNTIVDKSADIDPCTYTIVMASDISMSGAKAFVTQLQRKGFQEAGIMEGKSILRVVYGRFSSEHEAYGALRELRKHPDFKEAWVMKTAH